MNKWVSDVAVPSNRKENKDWKALQLSLNLINWCFFLILMFLFKRWGCTHYLSWGSGVLYSWTQWPSHTDGQPGLWVDSLPPELRYLSNTKMLEGIAFSNLLNHSKYHWEVIDYTWVTIQSLRGSLNWLGTFFGFPLSIDLSHIFFP